MLPSGVAAVTPNTVMMSSELSPSDCSDCSHCAKRSSRRTRSGVRVSVNLRQFFSDQRARAFMWAPYGRCVQWLGRRIAHVFELPDDIALMSRGHMLPVSEPLLLLERDEPLEVVDMSSMFTTREKQNYSNIASLTSLNEISTLTGRTGINVRPIQSNMASKEDNVNYSTTQLPSSSQGDNLENHQNISSVQHSLEDIERTTVNQDVDESEDLQRLKERALRLLDDRYQVLQETSAPKRMRRRRRRRKLPATMDAPDASDEEKLQPRDAMPVPQNGDAVVLRNGFGLRPPRLVRALSSSPVLQNVP